MDDTESENMTETDATMTEVSKPEKPRGKCTGCAFSYQLGTARTGEHKGKLVIRKHNSRTGPGLCSGAQQPPESEHGTPPRTNKGHCEQGACTGCCGCSSMCTTDPCGQPYVPLTEIRLPVGPRPDVVGVAPGGTPVVADPWTAPVPAPDTENGSGDPDGKLGPWVTAAFDGDCDGTSCGGRIVEGEQIRADGEGGWLCEPCGEDAEIVKTDHGPHAVEATAALSAIAADDRQAAVAYETNMRDLAQSTLPPHTVLAPDAQVTVTYPVMPPVSISEVHAENPPRVTALSVPPVDGHTPDLFTAPAPASDIPESTTTVSGQPEPDRDRWGRYLIMGQAHTRATTFAKLGANTKAIEAWNERNVIRGLTLRPDLLMLANGLEVKRDRDQLNSIASQAKDAAGSKVAANIGTAYHAFSERIDAGLMTLEDVPPQYRARVQQYITKVADAGLTTRPEWIERTTAVRADQISAPLPVAGTLDRIFQLPDGSLVIGDLKTGSDLSYGEMEIEVQLALYAHGVNTHGLFDWNTKTWQPVGSNPHQSPASGKVRTDIAIVVHLPADGDGCTLYVADIERGWRDAQRLGQLQASLKDKPKGKRFRTLMASDLAPHPAPVAQTAPEHIYDDGHGGLWTHPGWLEDCTTPECVAGRTGFQTPGYVAAHVPAPEPTAEQYMAATAHHPTKEGPQTREEVASPWEHAKHLFSTAPDQATIAQLYQFALDSGKFHQDQLAVLVGLGKDRLNALARG